MKFIKKLLSSATAVLLTGTCILSSMNYANADFYVKINTDISQSDLEEMTKDMYTLDQLFAMSDEEFAKLVDSHGNIGQSIINDLMNACDISRVDRDAAFGFDTHDDIGLSGYLLNYCGDTNDDDYKEGTTEVLLKYLFGDTVNYKIQSPSFDLNRYDGWISNWNPYIWISIPDYDICRYKRNENDEWFINEDLTDEKIIETAKCVFCANQVKSGFSMHYRDDLGVYSPNHEEPETIIPITTSPAETTVTTVTTTLTTTENKPQTTVPNTTEPKVTTGTNALDEDTNITQSDIEEMTKDMYTLDQLFAMSDEEFASLRLEYDDDRYITGQDIIDILLGQCTNDKTNYDLSAIAYMIGLSGIIECECYSNWKDYKEGITEAVLNYLLGDTVNYTIESPSFDLNRYDGWISNWDPWLTIYLPDYDICRYKRNENDEYVINEELTRKKITEAAKCAFCTKQVTPCFYMERRGVDKSVAPPPVTEPVTTTVITTSPAETTVTTDPVVTTTSPVNTTPLGTTSTTVATTVSSTKSSETTATKASTTEPKVTTGTNALDEDTNITQSDIEEMTKGMYTLDQLFAMSDDEFLQLGANVKLDDPNYVCYNVRALNCFNDLLKTVYKFDEGLSGVLECYLDDENDPDYQKDNTEALLRYVLGDTVKYEITSPSFDRTEHDGSYAGWRPYLTISFPDYDLPKEIELGSGDISENYKLDDHSIMEFAKCLYCVRQVTDDFVHQQIGTLREPSTPPEETAAITLNTKLTETTTTTVTTAENKPQTTAPVTTEPSATTIVTTAENKPQTTALVTTAPVTTTVTTAENKPQTTAPTETPKVIFGDANGDNSINVSDCVFIAHNIAKGAELPDSADYNKDGKKNVLDASALSRDIAENKLN